jgi:hypothetical protein
MSDGVQAGVKWRGLRATLHFSIMVVLDLLENYEAPPKRGAFLIVRKVTVYLFDIERIITSYQT